MNIFSGFSLLNHVTFDSLIYIRRKAQYCGRLFSDLFLVSYSYLVFFLYNLNSNIMIEKKLKVNTERLRMIRNRKF